MWSTVILVYVCLKYSFMLTVKLQGSRCCISEPMGETLLMPVCYSVGWQLKSWIRGVAFFRPTDCAGQMILALAYPIPQFLNHYRTVSLIVTQMIARLFWNKIIPLRVTRWHCGDDDIVSRAHQCANVRRTTRAVARQESVFRQHHEAFQYTAHDGTASGVDDRSWRKATFNLFP